MLQVRNPKRLASLTGVCAQATILAVVLNVSSRTDQGQPVYKASSAVLLTELAKLILSGALAYNQIRCSRAESNDQDTGNPIISLVADRTKRPALRRVESSCPTVVINVRSRRSSFTIQEPIDQQATSLPASRRNSRQLASQSKLSSELSRYKYPDPSSQSSPRSEQQLPNTASPPVLLQLWQEIFSPDMYKMSFPAFLFLIQNILIYVAARNLSMAVFQITFQLKTLITALCAVVMLGRRYTPLQWLSLLLLGLGVATIQLASSSEPSHAWVHPAHWVWSDYFFPSSWHISNVQLSHSQIIGFLAVLVSCTASAVASTYFELVLKRPAASAPAYSRLWLDIKTPASLPKVQNILGRIASCQQLPGLISGKARSMRSKGTPEASIPLASAPKHSGRHTRTLSESKKEPVSLWIKNVQLALFSLMFGAVYSYATCDGTSLQFFTTFLQGFDSWSWAVVVIQAVGGLFTALVIKYADNVAKSFALSASIVVTFALSVMCFNYHLTLSTAAGAGVVLLSAVTFERFGQR